MKFDSVYIASTMFDHHHTQQSECSLHITAIVAYVLGIYMLALFYISTRVYPHNSTKMSSELDKGHIDYPSFSVSTLL